MRFGTVHVRAKGRWLIAAVAIMVMVIATTSSAFAQLASSTFESSDGNLVVTTAGNHDWNSPVQTITCGSTIPSAGINCGTDLTKNTADNAFGQGSKEDVPNPTVVDGSIPPNKSDLTRFYVNRERAGGKDFLYLAWERSNILGSANMDFEFNQSATLDGNGVTPVRSANDILITFDFTNGGGNPVLGLLRWVTSGPTSQCFSSNSLPCWGNRVDLSAAGIADGAVNTVSVTDTNPPLQPDLPALTFGEAAINITDAGIFPQNQCFHLGSTFLKSRSSASFNAEMKDFIAPIPVNITNCGTLIIKKVTDPSPDATNTSFPFSVNGPNPPNSTLPKSFSLLNGQSNSTQVFIGFSYSATETVPANWELTGASCDNNTGTLVGGSLTGISVPTDSPVTCTFFNHLHLGAIKITKTSSKGTHPGLDGAKFAISSGGTPLNGSPFTTSGGGFICVDHLPFGSYSVQEVTAPAGYKIDDPTAHTVTVNADSSCGDGHEATFAATDTPLSNIIVTFHSQVPGATSATIQCTGDPVALNLPDNTPRTLADLVPGTYTCIVIIDP